jgi:hypothetical protein
MCRWWGHEQNPLTDNYTGPDPGDDDADSPMCHDAPEPGGEAPVANFDAAPRRPHMSSEQRNLLRRCPPHAQQRRKPTTCSWHARNSVLNGKRRRQDDMQARRACRRSDAHSRRRGCVLAQTRADMLAQLSNASEAEEEAAELLVGQTVDERMEAWDTQHVITFIKHACASPPQGWLQHFQNGDGMAGTGACRMASYTERAGQAAKAAVALNQVWEGTGCSSFRSCAAVATDERVHLPEPTPEDKAQVVLLQAVRRAWCEAAPWACQGEF